MAFIAGPLLGGVLVDSVGWRWIFGINVLPIAVTLYLLAVLRAKDVRKEGVRIDYPGAVLCVLGLAGPVYALIEQGNYGWGSPLILMPLVLGILCFAGFIWREKTAKHPLLPLSLFSVRNFAVGNVATAFVYAALSIGGFIIVLFLQQVAGFPATSAALALLPVSLVNILLASWFGSLAGRFGPAVVHGIRTCSRRSWLPPDARVGNPGQLLDPADARDPPVRSRAIGDSRTAHRRHSRFGLGTAGRHRLGSE
ncbi:hypothetical protein NicSoilC12_26860 [Arthrobacter sp. NicSoilC12]|nr:hypothetical protein NicSoilC12_26860 [Arthrobacter sp. NicSoilC12]